MHCFRAVAAASLALCACTTPDGPPEPGASAQPAASATSSAAASASAPAIVAAPSASVVHDPNVPLPPKAGEVQSFTESLVLVAWRLDGKAFAASNGFTTVIHSTEGKPQVTLPKAEKGNLHLVFSPKGDLLATLDAGGVARVFDAATGKLVVELPGKVGDYPGTVAFAPDASTLAGVGTQLVVWDLAKKTERCRAETSNTYQVVVSDDNSLVLGTGGGHWVRWNAQTCASLADDWARTGGTFGSVLDMRGRWFAAAEPDGHGLSLYEARSMKAVEALAASHGCNDHVGQIDFSRDGEVLLAAGGMRWFKSFRTSSRKAIAAYDIPKPDEVSQLVMFDDGERLFVRRANRMTLVSAVSKEEVASFDVEATEERFEVSPDGKTLLRASPTAVVARDVLGGKERVRIELAAK
jgi:WD40 repeat protein